MDSKTVEAPYSDTFYGKECWIVVSESETSNKCIFLKFMKIVFVKHTFFESKIRKEAEKGI